ncbi:related to MFS transporter [Rhynchosporium agropyri]|uniref:Related to MFS transporter n=1 Tax=Rhynchosporium agropyri TaxID=914238 RepID=A0A1E1K7C2_9HELO|nr:related to MFS transporter [Rhynchosporium agropyri]
MLTTVSITPKIAPQPEIIESRDLESCKESRRTSESNDTHVIDWAPKVGYAREGGLSGWTCVLGSFFALFCTFGWLNSLGLFQTYYQETLLKQHSASTISWIFATQLFLMWTGGVFFGRIVDTYGTRCVAIPCAVGCTLSIVILSFCSSYYQIFLIQGVGFGVSAAGLFSCATTSVGQWFNKRKALALGIVLAGSSLGGLVHSFYLHILIGKVGFPTAVRYSAIIVGASSILACLLIHPRLPKKKWDSGLQFIDFSLFKQATFSVYCIGTFLIVWGLFAPWTYLPSMSLRHGFSADLAVYTIVILNAGSIIGRILPAYLADRFGRFNSVSLISFVTSIAFLAFWLPLEIKPHPSNTEIFAFSACYGFASGAFISLMMPCVAELGPVAKLGQRFGTYQAVIGLASLTSLPIQGALIPYNDGGFRYLILFSGVCVSCGTVFICAARMFRVGWNWKG